MSGLQLLLLLLAAAPDNCGPFEQVADHFWEFRARTMPYSADDIPRLERPPGLVRSWSKTSIQRQRTELAALADCLAQATLAEASWAVARRVDVRLIRSALARVRWELDVNRRWERDPGFYLDQALTPVLELLVEPPPIEASRAKELITRLRNIPAVLKDAEENLDGGVQLFAQLALERLVDIRANLVRVDTGVLPLLPKDATRSAFSDALLAAADALEGYRAWLIQHAPAMRGTASVGREAYVFFLQQVALIPYTPEQLLAMAQQEWERSVAAEALEAQRDNGLPPLAYIASLEVQLALYQKDELAIRKFLEERGILSVPAEVHHFTVRPITGVHRCARRFRRAGLVHRSLPPNPGRRAVALPALAKARLLRKGHRSRPSASHHARRRPWALLPARPVLETSGPNSAPLL